MALSSNKFFFITLGVIALLLAHTVVAVSWERDSPISASQSGKNTIRTERFLFSSNDEQCVLVGTSMTAGLDLLLHNPVKGQPDIANLAYAAASAATGLELILRTSRAPECVLIESNLAARPLEPEELNLTDNKILRAAKQHILILRHENQPLNMLLTLIRDLRNREHSAASTAPKQAVLRPRTPAGYQKVVPHIRKRQAELAAIPVDLLENGVENLIRQALALQARGSQIFFIEIPGESEVRETEYYKTLRRILATQLGRQNNLPQSSRELYQLDIALAETTDGVHLSPASLALVPDELFKVVNRQ